MQRKAADVSPADSPALVFRSKGLSTILNQGQIVLFADLMNRLVVGWIPVQMNGHYSGCIFGNGLLELLWIHRHRLRLDINQYRFGTTQPNRRDRGDVGVAYRNNFIALTDTTSP
jgi:hypothetical protein